MSSVFELAVSERKRQIEVEGFQPSEDDKYKAGELLQGAACYAMNSMFIGPVNLWPFHISWWKPSDPKRNIVKAMAMLAAEYERLERAEKVQS